MVGLNCTVDQPLMSANGQAGPAMLCCAEYTILKAEVVTLAALTLLTQQCAAAKT
jgi:hypothetical protein